MRRISPTTTVIGAAALAAGLLTPTAAVELSAPSIAMASHRADDSAHFTSAKPPVAGEITLVTGDVVAYAETPDGLRVTSVDPADEGGRTPGFVQTTADGDLYVIPDDVGPYLAADRVDKDLFNITDLAADGYDDTSRRALPLIVTYRATARKPAAQNLAAPTAAHRTRTLDSIDSAAVTVPKAKAPAFWDELSVGDAGLTDGVRKIWLDSPVRVALEDSVPQVGAPEAWAAGYDGTDVPVAVLDTGIDLSHPDLSGKVVEQANFTDEPDITDRHGHGTHVASTIAGSGAASDGLRKGVAPGVDLYIGKVLPQSGTAPESQVIAGMEWAATTDAQVVSISIGGGPTDGTDPMSQAVNNLSESSGALFVIAAGNRGSGESTVTAPGAAESALTVGAVSKTEQLAAFSGRGPRVGDYAVKPDITAPGVAIGAARAAGTTMGTPIDAMYTRADGTSMATPHVAGAAAILLQQHPDWDADQLKSALISTAQPNDSLTVYQQGGGRLDVGRALTQQLAASPATLSFFYDWPHADPEAPVERVLTYRNDGDSPVELDLTADVAGPDGSPSPAVTLDATQVTVPANGTANVTATIDPNAATFGRTAGYIEAVSPDGKTVHTTVGLYKESEMYDVTVTGIARDGRPAEFGNVVLWRYDAGGPYGDFQQQFFADGGSTLTFKVPPGRYTVMGMVATMDEPGVYPIEMTTVGKPDLVVDAARTVTLDARQARDIRVRTPRESEPQGFILGWHRDVDGRTFSGSYTLNEFTDLASAVPSPKASRGSFEFFSRWRQYAPAIQARADSRRPVELHLEHMLPVEGVPRWDDRGKVRAVYVGAGRPEDYEGRDLSGAVAVVQRTEGVAWADQLAGAVDGGARGIILIYDRPGLYLAWAGSTSIPAFTLGQREGQRLVDWMEDTSRPRLEMEGTANSPFVYDLVFAEHGAIPKDLSYAVSRRNTARVDTTYHGQVPDRTIGENRNVVRPYGFVPIEFLRQLPAPFERTEWLTGGATQWWQQSYAQLPFTGSMWDTQRSYVNGRHIESSWWKQAVRSGSPAAPVGSSPYTDIGQPAYRIGDELRFTIPEFNDAGRGHYGWYDATLDTSVARLYRDGEYLGEVPRLYNAVATVPRDPATYRLTSDLTRTAPWWRYSTGAHTAWEFESAHSDGVAYLPLLQVDLDLRLDGLNRAQADRDYEIGVGVRHQPGVDDSRIRLVRVWASTDDGATWERARLRGRDGDYTAEVDQRSGDVVSLRIEATDAAGNRVEQAITRAYAVR